MNATATRTATARQLSLIATLSAEINFDAAPDATTDMSMATASSVITYLLDTKRKAAAVANAAAHVAAIAQEKAAALKAKLGHYLIDGNVIRVQLNKERNRVYAVRMVVNEATKKGSWVYQGSGIMARLAGLEPMTVAQAAALGHHYGVCMICGAELTNAKSVEQGIGPVCAKKL